MQRARPPRHIGVHRRRSPKPCRLAWRQRRRLQVALGDHVPGRRCRRARVLDQNRAQPLYPDI